MSTTSRVAPGVVEFPRPQPVYIVGDSHAFAFSDRVFAADSGRTYLFRAVYAPIRARDFMDGETLEPRIAGGLEASRALVRDGDALQAWQHTTLPQWQWVYNLDDRSGRDPAIVLTAGSADVLDAGGTFTEPDFVLTEAVLNRPDVPSICKENLPGALPAGDAWKRFAEPLEGLRAALRFLRERGIERLAVLGAPPPTLDEAQVRRTMEALGHVYPEGHDRIPYVYKVMLTVNHVLRGICEDEGVHYIDRWRALAHDGLALPETLRDLAHVTPDAATATVEEIVAWLEDTAPPQAVPDRTATAAGAVRALLAPAPGMRVLDAGGSGRAIAGEGAQIIALDTAADASEYDAAIAAGVLDGVSPGEAGQLYAALAEKLRPAGYLVVHASPDPNAVRSVQRPARLRHQLRAVFEHVHVWVGSAEDPGGSLARGVADAAYGPAPELFAIASHAPLDRDAVVRRILGEVGLDAFTAPPGVEPGKNFEVEVTLANRTPFTLLNSGPTPARFAYSWFDRGGATADEGRSRLPVPSEPGTTQRLTFEILAPLRRGKQTLRLTLLQEHLRRFDASAEVAIDVG